MSNGLSIRPALRSDADAVLSIYLPHVLDGTATFEIEPIDAAEIERRISELEKGAFPYLVAEENGLVTGYAYVAPFRTRAAFVKTVENSVYVAPSAVRRGIGVALLTALIEASTARGFKQMLAVIGDPDVQSASIALHTKAQFTVVGRLPGVGIKFGRALDVLLMQRALDP